MKHKHAEVIKAWADGAEIQSWTGYEWSDAPHPHWANSTKHRVKPKPDVVERVLIGKDLPFDDYCYKKTEYPNLELIWDGETGMLKDAKVIK